MTVDEVTEVVDDGAVTVEAVGELTLAGTGCGMCHDRIEDLIEARCGSCPLAALAVA